MACRIFSSTFSDPSDYGAAQAQIEKMKTALQTPNSAKVKPLLKAAFGEQGTNYQLPEVIKTVNTLDKGIIQASIPTASFPDKNTIAEVPFTQNKPTDPWIAGPIEFGSKFHGKS